MHRTARHLPLAAALLAFTPLGASEPTAAQKLGKLLGSCEIALAEDWRDATAADYADPAWAAWSQRTGSATPWRAEADFDGDGRTDVARVLIHRRDAGRWMMGVKFGMAAGEDCLDKHRPRRFQLSDDGHGQHALAGVLALPKGSDRIVCHAAGDAPLICHTPDDDAFAARPGAALLTFDAQPSYVSGYFWRAMRSDGGSPSGWSPTPAEDAAAFWRLDFEPMRTEVDAGAMLASLQASAQDAKPGDRVDAAARKAVVAEFNAAWAALERAPRSRSVQSTRNGAGQPTVLFVRERLAPDRLRVAIGRDDGSRIETIRIGARQWLRAPGGEWSETAAEAEPAMPAGIVGAETIRGVRTEQRNGRAVKVLELEQTMGAATLRRTLVIDVARTLPLQIVDGQIDSPQVMTTDFDYDTPVSIEAP